MIKKQSINGDLAFSLQTIQLVEHSNNEDATIARLFRYDGASIRKWHLNAACIRLKHARNYDLHLYLFQHRILANACILTFDSTTSIYTYIHSTIENILFPRVHYVRIKSLDILRTHWTLSCVFSIGW